jgi:hypothetical protein
MKFFDHHIVNNNWWISCGNCPSVRSGREEREGVTFPSLAASRQRNATRIREADLLMCSSLAPESSFLTFLLSLGKRQLRGMHFPGRQPEASDRV